MSLRRAAKRDTTEPGIVKTLEAHGWTVIRLSDAGAPDLLAIRKGVLVPLECKSPGGTLTPAQQTAFMRWVAAGMPVQVVRTPEEALRAVGATVEGVLPPKAIRVVDHGNMEDPSRPARFPSTRLVMKAGISTPEDMAARINGDGSGRAAMVESGTVVVRQAKPMGHVVTPEYQREQTEAVVPKRRKSR